MTVEIVLATYNGAYYLAAQLDSLLAQDVTNWRLLVRDDGSADETLQVVQGYMAKFPDKIHLVEDKQGKLGAVGNFSALLAATTAPYVMCCDQDDVWMPHKISRTLSAMQALEQEHGADAALLVYTDSTIVNETLEVISPSFAAYHRLQPAHCSLARLLVQNTVQGCTVMINRGLLSSALPIPNEARMYDMWLAQVAAGLGHIRYLAEPTLYYRQHGNNAVGARKKTLGERAKHIQQMMVANSAQARVFAARYGAGLNAEQHKQVAALGGVLQHGFIARRMALLRYGLLRRPLWQNLPILAYV